MVKKMNLKLKIFAYKRKNWHDLTPFKKCYATLAQKIQIFQ